MKFVVYEVWTRAKVVEAENEEMAYKEHAPVAIEGLNLCNWHVVLVPAPRRTPSEEFRLHLAGEDE